MKNRPTPRRRKEDTVAIDGSRVAICNYAAPSFDRDSGSLRLLDAISFLREAGADVTFISAHPPGPRNMRYVRHLRQMGIPVYGRGQDPVEDLIEGSAFDLALLTFWPVAELFMPMFRSLSPDTRIIVDSVDLHFLRDARRFAQITSPQLQAFDSDYGAQVVGELNAYSDADLVLTVSQKEADVLADYLGRSTPVHAVPDCEELEQSRIPMSERAGILFIGSFLHAPNVLAAEMLCREIVPRIDSELLERNPVYIVGDGLNDTIRSFAADNPHINLVGWVPTLIPYLERARVSILPLLYGAGTKRKLVQSLMIGAPTVCTPVAVEGLELESDKHTLVAEDAEGLAAAVSRLLVEPETCEEIAAAGREVVLERQSRSVARSSLLAAADHALQLAPKAKKVIAADLDLFLDRMVYQEHQRLRDAIFEKLQKVLPGKAVLAVMNSGSAEMLRLDPYTTMQFPPAEEQVALFEAEEDLDQDTEEALRELEEIRARTTPGYVAVDDEVAGIRKTLDARISQKLSQIKDGLIAAIGLLETRFRVRYGIGAGRLTAGWVDYGHARDRSDSDGSALSMSSSRSRPSMFNADVTIRHIVYDKSDRGGSIP